MSDLLKDLQLGVRLLLKSPGYSLVVALTLALAIGANAIIFAFTDLLLIRPLPFGNPARIVFIFSVNAQRGIDRARVSLPDFADFRSELTRVEEVAAFGGTTFTMTGDGDPVRITALRATANLFTLWELPTVLGRAFLGSEDKPGAPHVAVLSHRFWASHFNANPASVGRSVMLNGEPYTIVGVLSPAMEVGNFEEIDLWVPIAADPAAAARDDRSLRVVARLKNGASLEEASAEVAAVARRIEEAHQSTNQGWSARPLKLRDAIVGKGAWEIIAVLTIVVGFVLIVACANIANMMLARAIARQKEIAVRVALGATRSRIVRQMVTESVVLGLAGGLLGLLVTRAGIKGIQATADNYIFRNLSVSSHLITFAFALSVLAPLVFSLLPALQASRADLNDTLKEASHRASGGPTGRKSRAVLVVSQLALALMLVFVAALAARSVAAARTEPPGIQTANVLTVHVQLEAPKYQRDDQALPFAERTLERIATLPGVSAAAVANALPMVDPEATIRFDIAGRPKAAAQEVPWAVSSAITPEYAAVFALHLAAGRAFSRYDTAAAPPVAVISRETVRRYWPSSSAIGEFIQVGGESRPIQIVGVVDDVKGEEITDPAPPRIYRPFAQAPARAIAIVARTSGDPLAIAPSVREVLRDVDRDVAVSPMRPLEDIMRERFAENYVLLGLFGSFALVALVLAGTGLYGVTAYGVSQRTQEIGIRMALGASPASVLSLVVGQNARLIAIGAVIGAAGGAALGRAMQAMLFHVGPTDPATFAEALAVLGGIALVATYVPARRASHIDPLLALRHE